MRQHALDLIVMPSFCVGNILSLRLIPGFMALSQTWLWRSKMGRGKYPIRLLTLSLVNPK